MGIEERTTGHVPKDFRLSKDSMQRAQLTIPTRRIGRTTIPVLCKGCLTFSNHFLIRPECAMECSNGFLSHASTIVPVLCVRLPPSSRHQPPMPVQWTNWLQSVTRLATPICGMWSIRVVTQTHYPNERSLTSPQAMSLEILHS
jgi:hypothetical protein